MFYMVFSEVFPYFCPTIFCYNTFFQQEFCLWQKRACLRQVGVLLIFIKRKPSEVKVYVQFSYLIMKL